MEGDNDHYKAQVWGKYKSFRLPIMDKVEEWMQKGWERWMEERPDWFTDRWIADVLVDMIPKEKKRSGGGGGVVKREKKVKGRRKSSIFGRQQSLSKIVPDGSEGQQVLFNEKEFKLAMTRKGSVRM